MLSFLLFLIAVVLTGFSASRFRPGTWHENLIKPSWNPPNWVFAPVWSVLYLFMAISGWLIWYQTHDLFHPALIVWIMQLGVNGLWSYLFFGRHTPGLTSRFFANFDLFFHHNTPLPSLECYPFLDRPWPHQLVGRTLPVLPSPISSRCSP
jgi:tryptophan-rich sensory protein